MNDKPSHLRVVGTEPETETAVETKPRTFEDLVLRDTQYGDELLGELTDEQVETFIKVYDLRGELKDIDREISGTLFEKFGRDIRSGSLDEATEYNAAEHIDPSLMKRLFNAKALSDKLTNDLFWEIGEQYNAHDYTIAIRTKRRIVKCRRKW